MKKSTSDSPSVFVTRAIGSCGILFYVICALWLAIPSIMTGQSLDDFKTAAGNRGVQSIPFQSLREAARSLDDKVNELGGKTLEGFNSKTLVKQKDNLLAAVKVWKDDIEGRNIRIEALKSASSEIDGINPYITELKN